MKYLYPIVIVILLAAIGVLIYALSTVTEVTPEPEPTVPVTSFKECVDAGYPVSESFPRRCGEYTEFVGNAVEKMNLIQITSPMPNDTITSPLTITGQARGNWYFEATFPVILTDWDGLIIAEGYATATSDWMTEDFVPFTATLTYTTPSYGANGTLILQKSNASGEPQYDDALEIPILF